MDAPHCTTVLVRGAPLAGGYRTSEREENGKQTFDGGWRMTHSMDSNWEVSTGDALVAGADLELMPGLSLSVALRPIVISYSWQENDTRIETEDTRYVGVRNHSDSGRSEDLYVGTSLSTAVYSTLRL